jgi:hypothetical protein
MEAFIKDFILNACLTRKGEFISAITISAILKNPEIKEPEVILFIKYLENNLKDEIAETIVKPNKIQIKSNSITEKFIIDGGFTEIEKNKSEIKKIENDVKAIDAKHKMWSYKNRYFSLIISIIALIISFITIAFKIYETMYPKESKEIKTMKKEILQLKSQDSLFLLEKNQKK